MGVRAKKLRKHLPINIFALVPICTHPEYINIIIYRFLERHILKALWRFTIMKINKKLQKTIKSLFKKKGLKAPFECV